MVNGPGVTAPSPRGCGNRSLLGLLQVPLDKTWILIWLRVLWGENPSSCYPNKKNMAKDSLDMAKIQKIHLGMYCNWIDVSWDGWSKAPFIILQDMEVSWSLRGFRNSPKLDDWPRPCACQGHAIYTQSSWALEDAKEHRKTTMMSEDPGAHFHHLYLRFGLVA